MFIGVAGALLLFQQEVERQQSEFRDSLSYYVSQFERESLRATIAFTALAGDSNDPDLNEEFSQRVDVLWARVTALTRGSIGVEFARAENSQAYYNLALASLIAIDKAIAAGGAKQPATAAIIASQLNTLTKTAGDASRAVTHSAHRQANQRRATLYDAYQKTVLLGGGALFSGSLLLIFFLIQNRKLTALGGDLERLVTARTRELEKSRQHAEIANAGKSQFLANMSHELRTPLNAIIGFSEIINNELFGPVENKRYKNYIGDIHKSASHLSALLKDILDLTKIAANEKDVSLETFDAVPVVNQVVSLLESIRRKKGQQISFRLPSELWLHSDALMIKQILLNLLSNAYRFTPAAGQVVLSLDLQDELAFEIEDNGVGMSPEVRARVLEPFYQHRETALTSGAGTGVGLSLSNQLARLLQGRLVIDSAPGVGTKARLVLPRHLLQPPADRTAPAKSCGLFARSDP
jgi:signal transduction histidine kinase